MSIEDMTREAGFDEADLHDDGRLARLVRLVAARCAEICQTAAPFDGRLHDHFHMYGQGREDAGKSCISAIRREFGLEEE